jgi:outer membrane protein assembly factor BamB
VKRRLRAWADGLTVVALLVLAAMSGSASSALAATTVRSATTAPTASAPVTADWPTYLADGQRSGASPGDTMLSPANAGQLAKLWSFKTGGVIAASATVVSGTVYVGSWDGYEYALDALSGALKWKTFLGITSAPGCSPASAGVSSAATVSGGVVYVGGGDSFWYALDAGTGNILWRVFSGDNSASGGHYNWSSPLVYNGFAYVGVASLGDCPLVQGQLLKVNLTTQQVVGTFNVVPAGQVGGGVWTSPAVDPVTNTIFMTTGTISNATQTLAQAFVAVDANTLALKDSWQLPPNQAVIDSDWGTSPTLFSDSANHPLIAAINKNGYAYALNRANLAAGPVWQVKTSVGGVCPTCGDGSVSSGAFAGGNLFLGGGNATTSAGTGYAGMVRSLDPATGAFHWEHGAPGPVVPALGYANGLVIDGAGAWVEVLNASDGSRLYSFMTNAPIFGSPSVASGEIFAGSSDGSVYAFGLPNPPPPAPPADGNCPAGWTCQDVGSPSPPGAESGPGGWTVTAGGAGIAATSDAFRLVSAPATGDTQMGARVTAFQTAGAASQVGVMVRQTADRASPYYAALLSGAGLKVQSRAAFGGATTVSATVASAVTPLYMQLQRVGDQFQAATSPDGVVYTLVPGSTVTLPLPKLTLAGIAVSSALNGTPATATLSSVAIGAPGAAPVPVAPPSSCPTSWSCGDVGNPALVGDQSLNAGTWTLQGAGTDISGYNDQFHFVWQVVPADGTIGGRVVSQANTIGSAKAGVMLRQSTDGGSPYYAAFLTPGTGVQIRYRAAAGLRTTSLTSFASVAPAYMEVARSGNTFTSYTSSDGVTWSAVTGSSVSLSITTSVLAGLAVTSANGTMGSATFDTISVATTSPPPPNACPAGWNCGDIGNAPPGGTQSLNSSTGTWTIQGAGSDIWTTSDQFHFAWQTLSGGGSVSARITSQTNTDPWAKAGVMLRVSSDPGAPYYAVFVTPGNGLTVQDRAAQGGTTLKLANPPGSVPAYLQVANNGSTFTAYSSADGVTWTAIAGSTVTLNLGSTLLAGLAVTSHNAGVLGTAIMDTVLVSTSIPPPPPPPPCPISWTCADIGNPTPTGGQSFSGGSWTVQGGGADIFYASDQFHFISQSLAGTGNVSAHITTQTATDPWAKAGVMLRQSSDAGSAYFGAFVTPGNGLTVQYRNAQGATTVHSTSIAGATVPVYLSVADNAGVFTAYTSPDGAGWTPIAGSAISLPMTSPLLAGVAATSHNLTALSTVNTDTVTLSNALPPPPPPPPPPPCPTGYTCADIGNPTPPGTQSMSGSTWIVQGGGADIFGASDQFRYIYSSLTGNGSVSAHVTSQTNTDPWAKAGVMLRQSSDPGSAYYGAFITPSNGVTVQYRKTQGGLTVHSTSAAGTVPTYLLVASNAGVFTAYTSSDGTTWTQIPGSAVTLNVTSPLLAGVAVTSHNSASLSSVNSDTVTVGAFIPPPPPPPPPPPCPSGYSCADIGNPTPSGTQSMSGSIWTMQGGGADIFGSSDQFRYIYSSLAGNGSVSAHVTSQTNTDPWAKAGVMLRQSSDPASAYYGAFITPSNGVTVQYRGTLGAVTVHLTNLNGATVPLYLLVADNAGVFTAYTSSDGASWTPIPGSTVTLGGLVSPLLAGVGVTSHNSTALSTVNVDTVTIGTFIPPPPPPPPPPPCPTSWSCADIGTTGGSQSLSGGTWTLKAAGADIYGTGDQFHYVWQTLAADGSISAHVTSQTNTSNWAKAGVMLRATTDPGSPNYAVFVTPSNGISVQARTLQGGTTTKIVNPAGAVPAYLRVARSGTSFSAYTSTDGVTWTLLPGSTMTINMTGALLEGMAVTSHTAGAICTVTMDSVMPS